MQNKSTHCASNFALAKKLKSQFYIFESKKASSVNESIFIRAISKGHCAPQKSH
jgi:hypothetical protein